MVWSADAQARPLRRARVMLNGDALPVGRTAIVDDTGAFAFDGLPSGRYTLTAAKEGYVTAAYGARKPERPGRTVALRNGEIRGIALRLPHGAVITGTVLDPDGEPVSGITVSVLTWRYTIATGERRPVTVGAADTDDRGVYRIYGLAAGEYVVHAVPRVSAVDVQASSDEEINRALAGLRQNSAFRSRPGIAPAPLPLPSVEPRRSVRLAPVFYPGTTVATRAQPIDLGSAEERAAVDFQLEYVPTAAVGGIVSEAASVVLMPSAQSAPWISNVRGTRAGSDGHFTFSGVPPGEYTVLAMASTPMTSWPPGVLKAAQTEVLVNGDDMAGISLALQSGLTVSGRVVFEGVTPPLLTVPGLRLPAPAFMPLGPTTVPLPSVQLHEHNQFTVAGILPGLYRIASSAPGIRTPLAGWWLKSVVVNGRDVLDSEVELRADRDDVLVTFSDRASELGGRVIDGSGEAWVDGFVVVFSTDHATWFFNSRRVAGARPNSEGRYSVRNLPPGEYLVAASDDILAGEWFDPMLLEQLAPRAARIRIGENEKKTYDIIVR
jgi:hypothetical protein